MKAVISGMKKSRSKSPRADEKVGNTVQQLPDRGDLAAIAASTATAVHSRDHSHPADVHRCHPHVVEVVYLGHWALTVCHDCPADSGFVPSQEAEHLAEEHKVQTLLTSVWLPGAVGVVSPAAL
jgi:hypothetical protein